MASDDNPEQEQARKLIAEANKTLARLQSARLHTYAGECLVGYNRLWRDPSAQGRPPSFTVDPAIMQFLSGAFDEKEFVDSDKSEELDRVAESFAQQLRLHRKRLKNDFDVFLCHNSEDKRQVRSIGEQLKRRGFLPWLDEQEIRPGMTWQKTSNRSGVVL